MVGHLCLIQQQHADADALLNVAEVFAHRHLLRALQNSDERRTLLHLGLQMGVERATLRSIAFARRRAVEISALCARNERLLD